jgi:hypothetical protein
MALSEAVLTQIGRNADQIMTCDLLCYGAIGPLYAQSLARQGGPLSLKAARMLQQSLAGGRTVAITTGLILPGCHPHGETDGPLGAVVLARALALGTGARVIVICEEELMPLLAALLRTAGLKVVAEQDLAVARSPVAAVVPLSRDAATARAAAAEMFDRHSIAALVSVERNGRNHAGIYAMVNGTDLSDTIGKGVELFAAARDQNIPTVGIGDRGNELGFGPVSDIVAALLPKGAIAADVTPSDLAVPASVSNWGCYAIACCLAALLDEPELLHSADLETSLAFVAQQNGGIDGMTGRADLATDGMGAQVSAAIATLLCENFRAMIARHPVPFSTPLIR